ncbi:MAG: glycosyltransferase family 2 protein [Pirellulales bacterium]
MYPSTEVSAPHDLDIGVVYTHERHYMGPLLNSMSRSGDGLSMRLVLVDNASADGAQPWRRIFPETLVLANRERLGYTANLNRILSACTARYVLLMNTDMYFEPESQCLSSMVRFMESHPHCGVGTCRIYHPDGSYAYPARRFQTPRIIALRRSGLGKLFPSGLDDYFYRERGLNETFDCEWVSGCFMLVRRAAIQEVGGFDRRFQKYFEDVDFCARMAQAGWKVMFNGSTHCFHHEQRASRRLLSKDAWQHLCSYGRWLWKWGLRPPQPARFTTASPGSPARRIDAAHLDHGSRQPQEASARRRKQPPVRSGSNSSSP